jgi:phosphatidylethanolamine-binding protein (PEBP) family uncharacterized protein
MTLQVSSPAFSDNGAIPRQFTCDGQNTAPPLQWSGVPEQSKSIAVICDDPDAPSGSFNHSERPAIGTAGVNSFGEMGFGGPCPPAKDDAHHYQFHVYALDVDSIGPAGLSKEDALQAMKGHILAEGDLVGTYKRASASRG